MIDRLNYQFVGPSFKNADRREKIGETLLKPARLAFGCEKTRIFVSARGNSAGITKVKASVVYIFAFFLTLPLSLPLTTAGALLLGSSNTHMDKYAGYISPEKKSDSV
ncbi:hypothetical protein [Waddlia chondrophila]|uniref:hypothetical protein n=1 Tax=Waddlia chondrophila TaxID=71667 RepID=UPI00030D7AEB|nr:hypothetical protein [Waddlia chondrophila]